MNVLSRKRLVDTLVEAYVGWREACARVEDTYRDWAIEPGSRDQIGFELYMAALDAEEHAAEIYGRLARRAGQLHRNDDPVLEPREGPAWDGDRS